MLHKEKFSHTQGKPIATSKFRRCPNGCVHLVLEKATLHFSEKEFTEMILEGLEMMTQMQSDLDSLN